MKLLGLKPRFLSGIPTKLYYAVYIRFFCQDYERQEGLWDGHSRSEVSGFSIAADRREGG